MAPVKSTRLGLKENWLQFTLLVVVNAFVGGMVGLERTILPQLAETEFQLSAHTAILSFIVVFGVTKAIANYYTGRWANKVGRKNLLVIGWLFGLPVPLFLMFAQSWNGIMLANVFLGINQGLAWSSTVVMKIDLVGEKNRGLAMGLNEFAGYLAVGLTAFATGWIAAEYGLRPYPFYIGIVLAVGGLLISWFFIKDTAQFVQAESAQSGQPLLKNIFWQTSWKHSNLGSITQAGLINNLNDGLVWGLFPVLLAAKGFTMAQISIIVAVYPAFWGMGQLITGRMADYFCKKKMLFFGMLMQGLTLWGMIGANAYAFFLLLSALLGIGTAIVYPTFLAAIAENTHPVQRSQSLGVFRLWRDLGYAIGAILTGLIADWLGIQAAVLAIGGLTTASAIIVHVRMRCQVAKSNNIALPFILAAK